MLKRVALVGAGVGLVVAAVWFMGGKLLFFPTKPTMEQTAQKPQDTNTNSTSSSQSAINFALESINMKQGEGGLELWRLKAHWANIRHEDNVIVVEKPKLDYALSGSDNKHLFINSLKGEIDQAAQTIHFLGDVDAQYEKNTIYGPTLVYNGTAHTMSFPEPSRFVGEDMQGSADKIVWLMPTRIIEAQGNVIVHLQGKPVLSGPATEQPIAPEVPPAPEAIDTVKPATPEEINPLAPNAKVDNTAQDVQTMGATPVVQEAASKPQTEPATKAVQESKPAGDTKAKTSKAPVLKKAPTQKKAPSPKKVTASKKTAQPKGQKKSAKSVTKSAKKVTKATE
ncbi:LPS export ABC transporter periplasmic protein LptC [Desulfovibrio cuneatus]|uniref:LPS export ABC transporter periplasmic protein LptC n=1 Tax=Desulfovibrio cuneatus TaxID=159728 RepID=UPI00040C0901|nr:LPS export ABC transporter periplasmic protein LptC [Desulfovibrio cuneatus]